MLSTTMLRFGPFPLGLPLLIVLALNGSSGMRHLDARRQLTLWAWERPERLTFLRSKDVGVAFLAGTIDLSDEPVSRLRFQPLQVNEGTYLTAVVRLETTASTPSVFSEHYRGTVARQILYAANLPGVRGLQIDFDATESQREFYRDVLERVRLLIPSRTPLSITALASWCLGDDWIHGLPIEEAVPMMFRMGKDRSQIMEALRGGQEFSEPLCQGSVGLSIDEPWPVSSLGKKLYVFSPHAWSTTSFAAVQKRLEP